MIFAIGIIAGAVAGARGIHVFPFAATAFGAALGVFVLTLGVGPDLAAALINAIAIGAGLQLGYVGAVATRARLARRAERSRSRPDFDVSTVREAEREERR
ncbi:hypothetical protein [Salinarimonas ramus]|uniref:Uncharacterized protein n=1 Tax=Salinarimonas ramus TaxID=690164 RepID=A0A917QKC5_9HYPH|nr:hypothetical protein [Salinarimonas ramus]GGK55189.1 hypothetical protein GCM10011322_47340 [Salinarimonas ramus]